SRDRGTGQDRERTGESSTRGRDAKSVTLSSEQKTRIHEIVGKHREARADRVDFDVRVGVRVPHTVRVFPIPEEVIVIVPQYRGFKYIIVGDEMVILDPDTLEIVAVVPV